MEFQSEKEFNNHLREKIIPQLLEHLAKKVEKILKQELNEADISTETLKKYVTHSEITQNKNGYSCDIYINDILAQSEEGTKTWDWNGITLVKFISINGFRQYNGETIAWNMINWLENTGANGPIGNNPIKPIGMFDKTAKRVKRELNTWVKDFFKKL